MKNLLALLICMSLCMSILLSCNPKEAPEEADVSVEEALASLSQFFVNEGLVPGLSQRDMCLNMEKYSYQGEKITEILPGEHGDGLGGGGYSANGTLFGFNNWYWYSQESNSASYSNSFYSKIPLDGLTLPLEIAFGDSLETVCKKMGLSEDCREGLVSGEKKSLYQNGQVTVTLFYDEAAKESSSVYSYVLEYQKVYESVRAGEKPVTVTETMQFCFKGEGDPLAYFYVKVNENYKH